MYENSTIGSASQRISDAPLPVVNDSKLGAIADRIRKALSLADCARGNIGAELERLLGASALAQAGSPNTGPRPVPNGALDQLDDTISDLINTLEILNSQTHRLASI